MKKKITCIANGFGLSPVTSGGEVRFFNIISRIHKNFDITLLTTPGGIAFGRPFIKNSAIKIKKIKASFIAKKESNIIQRAIGYIISAFDSAVKIQKSGPGIIYTSSDSFCDIYPAYRAAKDRKVKWAAMLHHKYDTPFKRPGFFPLNLLLFIMQEARFISISRRASAVFVLDSPSGGQIKKFFIKHKFKGKIFKVRNGTKIPRSGLKISKKDKNLALFVGGPRPAKGLYDIVPVWRKAAEENRKYKLIIAGSGAQKHMDYLKSRIEKFGLQNNIKLEGYVSSAKLKALYEKASVFFMPSHEEGWGISVVDALLYGCRVVAYKLEVFRIFADKIITVKPFDREKMAVKVIRAYKKKGYRRPPAGFFKGFDWDIIAKKETEIFQSL